MARDPRFDVLFEPLEIGPVTPPTAFTKSHIARAWDTAARIR